MVLVESLVSVLLLRVSLLDCLRPSCCSPWWLPPSQWQWQPSSAWCRLDSANERRAAVPGADADRHQHQWRWRRQRQREVV